jgi:N-acetylmuramoyl-L-alanine amidase
MFKKVLYNIISIIVLATLFVGCATKRHVEYVDKKNKAKDTRTDAQKESLVNLLKQLRKLYPKAKIYGHRDFAKKDCPSFNAKEEYKNI